MYPNLPSHQRKPATNKSDLFRSNKKTRLFMMAHPTSPKAENAPISGRIEALDILRGFALFGVLLINTLIFSGPFNSVDPLTTSTKWWDNAAELVLLVGGVSAFYSIFSFMFGLGFAIQLQRAKGRDPAFTARFAIRLLVLIAIGTIHDLFIWNGDILVQYGIAGFLLLIFPWKSARGVAIGAVIFSVGFTAYQMVGAIANYGPTEPSTSDDIAQAIDYHSNSYSTFTRDNISRYFPSQDSAGSLLNYPLDGPWYLGLFLAGSWVVLSGKLSDWPNQRKLYRRVLMIAGPLAVLTKGLYAYWIVTGSVTQLDTIAPYLVDLVAGPAQGATYLCLLMLILGNRPVDQPPVILRLFAPVGKMALTNYLGQSVISVFVLYSFGLNLYGRFGIAATTLIACLLFGAQIAASGYWLQRFRMGPAELFWRGLTTGLTTFITGAGRPTRAPTPQTRPDPVG